MPPSQKQYFDMSQSTKELAITSSHKMLNARILMDMIITKLITHGVKNIDNHKHRITQD